MGTEKKQLNIYVNKKFIAALDRARGTMPRGAYIEKLFGDRCNLKEAVYEEIKEEMGVEFIEKLLRQETERLEETAQQVVTKYRELISVLETQRRAEELANTRQLSDPVYKEQRFQAEKREFLRKMEIHRREGRLEKAMAMRQKARKRGYI